jgi:hypothetical protein
VAHDGTGAGWDETAPADTDAASNGAKEIRDLRIGIAARFAKEHVDPAAASVGGEHAAGSAKAYYGGAAPTKRPDGTTNLSSGDAGRIWVSGTTISVYSGSAWGAVGSSNAVATAVLYHSLAAGTHAGSFTAGTWVTRPLNTEVDPSGIVTLAANRFTLAAGTYHLRARAPAFRVNGHQIRLRNITDSTTTVSGGAAHSGSSADYAQTFSEIDHVFTLASSKTFEIQHRCETTGSASSSFGRAANFGEAEIMCSVSIVKLS